MRTTANRVSLTAVLGLVCMAAYCATASAAIVAVQNFDGTNDALAGSFDPGTDNVDISPGHFWGVGNRNAWPQGFPAPGVPFVLADDTVFGYANGSAFAADDEGLFGMNSDLDNNYFAMAASDSIGAGQTASWSFNIAGKTSLGLSLDIGGDIDGDFAYDAGTIVTVTATIDAGSPQTLFEFTPATNPFAPGSMRPMDGGSNEDPIDLLFATGDATITKTFAEGGASTAVSDLYLDKSLVADGSLDNFATTIAGTGNILTINVTANMPFEGVAFDNMEVTGVPEPAGLALLSLGAAMMLRRRR